MGEKHYKWELYTALYQHYDNYCYVIFDKEDTETVIRSSIVSPKTINAFEQNILDIIAKGNRIENINDFYNEFKNTFYSDSFKLETVDSKMKW